MKDMIFKEIKNALSVSKILLLIFIFFAPYLYFFVQKDSYALRDELDVFTFMLEDTFTIVFAFITILVYVAHFSNEVKDRFLVYTRTRISIQKLLLIKLTTNILLTFTFFFSLILSCFIFSFYIQPSIGIISYFTPDSSIGLQFNDLYNRYTFSQLLEYGSWVYGISYSIWIAVNASLYAAIGFFSVLLIRNLLFALSLPFLIYIAGSFLCSLLNLTPFGFSESIFPFSYIQQPIWKSFVPCFLLITINLIMCNFTLKKIQVLDSLI